VRTLVVASDPLIEALMGDLVGFAGHQPFCCTPRCALGALGEWNPDVVLLDASLPCATLSTYEQAVKDRGVALVYFASTMSASEIRIFANQHDAGWFALPNGPKVLARVLDRAIPIAVTREPGLADRAHREGPHPAISQAMRTVAHARALAEQTQLLRDVNRELRDDQFRIMEACRESRAALRRAVREYSRDLRDRGISAEHARADVRAAINEHAAEWSAADELDALTRDADAWCTEVYAAA
jgi:hypothetical protein